MEKSFIIISVVVILITAINAAPLTTRCMQLLNSTGPYAYCDVATNTSQGDNSLRNLVYKADDVTETIKQLMCGKEENKKLCQNACFECFVYTLKSDRDVQNDRINGQLEELLLRLQDLNVTCAAEQSKEDSGNSSFINVCTTLKIRLQFLTKHISDYLEIEKCGCPIAGEKCHYEPNKELPSDGRDKNLKQMFCETYNITANTQKMLKHIYLYRHKQRTAESCLF